MLRQAISVAWEGGASRPRLRHAEQRLLEFFGNKFVGAGKEDIPAQLAGL